MIFDETAENLVRTREGTIYPRVAQRDALFRELALDLPLTNGHLAVLERHPRSCKHTGKHVETACGGHLRNVARLLSARCATRGIYDNGGNLMLQRDQ